MDPISNACQPGDHSNCLAGLWIARGYGDWAWVDCTCTCHD